MIKVRYMHDSDKQWLVGGVVGIVVWWIFVGRKRYSVKGMK